jgi:hypothetical protein
MCFKKHESFNEQKEYGHNHCILAPRLSSNRTIKSSFL